MSPARALIDILVRSAVLAALEIVVFWLQDRGDGNDALGVGLLFFLLLASVAFVWSLLDAYRRGPVPAVSVWVVVALLSGLALDGASAWYEGMNGRDAAIDLVGDAVFFAVLVGVPAAVGVGLGAVLFRGRAPAR